MALFGGGELRGDRLRRVGAHVVPLGGDGPLRVSAQLVHYGGMRRGGFRLKDRVGRSRQRVFG